MESWQLSTVKPWSTTELQDFAQSFSLIRALVSASKEGDRKCLKNYLSNLNSLVDLCPRQGFNVMRYIARRVEVVVLCCLIISENDRLDMYLGIGKSWMGQFPVRKRSSMFDLRKNKNIPYNLPTHVPPSHPCIPPAWKMADTVSRKMSEIKTAANFLLALASS